MSAKPDYRIPASSVVGMNDIWTNIQTSSFYSGHRWYDRVVHMGYFHRPIRRGAARKPRLAHLKPSQEISLVELYRLIDRPVLMQTTRNPGRVVYRDAYQVAAVPYRDRRTTSREL